MGKKALLVIDMARDFVLSDYNPNLALPKAMELVPRIRRLQEAFIKVGAPVIYATDRHLPNDFELKKWGPHSMKGTEGSQIVEGLLKEGVHVLERDWKQGEVEGIPGTQLIFEVEKGTYSSFTDNGGKPTALGALLEKLMFRPEDKLYITGVHTNCCDKHTAADAWFRGFVPVVITDCVAAFDNRDGSMGMGHEEALRYEKFWYDAELIDSHELLDMLSIVQKGGGDSSQELTS